MQQPIDGLVDNRERHGRTYFHLHLMPTRHSVEIILVATSYAMGRKRPRQVAIWRSPIEDSGLDATDPRLWLRENLRWLVSYLDAQ
jgi:hypothetical protein